MADERPHDNPQGSPSYYRRGLVVEWMSLTGLSGEMRPAIRDANLRRTSHGPPVPPSRATPRPVEIRGGSREDLE